MLGEEGSACELSLSDSYSCGTIEFEAGDDGEKEDESQYVHPDDWWRQKIPEWQMAETQKKSVRSFSEDGALLFSDDYIRQAVAEEEEKAKKEAEAAKRTELKKYQMEYEFHNYRPRHILCDSDEERERIRFMQVGMANYRGAVKNHPRSGMGHVPWTHYRRLSDIEEEGDKNEGRNEDDEDDEIMTYHPGHSERRNLKGRMTSASRRDWMQRRQDIHRYRFGQECQWHPVRRPGGRPGKSCESMNVDDEEQEEEEEAMEPNPKIISTRKGFREANGIRQWQSNRKRRQNRKTEMRKEKEEEKRKEVATIVVDIADEEEDTERLTLEDEDATTSVNSEEAASSDTETLM